MKNVVLDLTWLDIIFVLLALVSIGFNIWQFVERKKTFIPLKSMLTALFNDIKIKSLHTYQVQSLLFSADNPHEDIKTLKWDYFAYTNTAMQNLQGFQEIVVGLLVTLDPSDKEGNQAFKASDYGLKPEEKEMRKKFLVSRGHQGVTEK